MLLDMVMGDKREYGTGTLYVGQGRLLVGALAHP